jgi:hypothetical protein
MQSSGPRYPEFATQNLLNKYPTILRVSEAI